MFRGNKQPFFFRVIRQCIYTRPHDITYHSRVLSCLSTLGEADFLVSRPATLLPWSKPRYPFNREDFGPHGWYWRLGEGIFLPLLYTITYLLTYHKEQSTSWETNRFSASQKKFPALYGTRRFITAVTSARHLSLSWVSSIQSIPPHPTSWRSILILSSHLRLGLPSGLFPSELKLIFY